MQLIRLDARIAKGGTVIQRKRLSIGARRYEGEQARVGDKNRLHELLLGGRLHILCKQHFGKNLGGTQVARQNRLDFGPHVARHSDTEVPHVGSLVLMKQVCHRRRNNTDDQHEYHQYGDQHF